MKKGIIVLVGLVAVFALSGNVAKALEIGVAEAQVGPLTETFNVYTEKMSTKNHYIPSGWMGDYGDIKINDGWSSNTHSGNTCIQIIYTGKRSQGAGWIGVYWQNPANNWGDQMGGYDLTGYKKATFWARGKSGGEVIAEFKVGGISGMYSDSDSTGIGPVVLTKDWKQYTINLEGIDLSYISGGFEFSASLQDNPFGFTFYLDDIKFEK